MTSLRTSSTLIATIADIDSRLKFLRQEFSEHEKKDTDAAIKLEAEMVATKRIVDQLKQVDSPSALVDVYDEARRLITRIAEDPKTIGENAAGVYLRDKISSALQDLEIGTSPDPSPGAARKHDR